MTEQQWLECRNPYLLLRKASDRKLRLFAVACCGRVLQVRDDDQARRAIEASECYADGLIPRQEQRTARLRVDNAISDASRRYHSLADPVGTITLLQAAALTASVDKKRYKDWVGLVAEYAARLLAMARLAEKWHTGSQADRNKAEAKETAKLGTLLSDVMGSLFRPVAIDPAWQTPQAVALARTAYEERRFDDLPLLADALEEAGCSDEAMLAHLRGPGPHVRGCWVVDLVLNKK
jgi:hypothetical protein